MYSINMATTGHAIASLRPTNPQSHCNDIFYSSLHMYSPFLSSKRMLEARLSILSHDTSLDGSNIEHGRDAKGS